MAEIRKQWWLDQDKGVMIVFDCWRCEFEIRNEEEEEKEEAEMAVESKTENKLADLCESWSDMETTSQWKIAIRLVDCRVPFAFFSLVMLFLHFLPAP
jgi:hypothetical protein